MVLAMVFLSAPSDAVWWGLQVLDPQDDYAAALRGRQRLPRAQGLDHPSGEFTLNLSYSLRDFPSVSCRVPFAMLPSASSSSSNMQSIYVVCSS